MTEKLGEGHIAGAVNATAKGINKAKGLAHDYIIDPVAKRVRGAIDDQRIPRPKLDEHGKEMDVNYYGDLALQEGRLSNLSGESSKMIGDVAGHGAAAGIVGGGALAAAKGGQMAYNAAFGEDEPEHPRRRKHASVEDGLKDLLRTYLEYNGVI